MAKKIPVTIKSPLDYIHVNQGATQNNMFLQPTDPDELHFIIKNMKASSPGADSISPKIIKDTASLILKPLTHAINLSLIMGYFPEQLKLAKVIPIFKGGDPDLLSNYRPVSVLPAFSKLYERIYYKRLLSYISSQNILYDNQFGFRARHSTGLALNILVDKITESLDSGESTVGVFLDFSKAFDTVDHNILLSKLYTYGIRGPPLSWIRSYLSNRQQFVSYNNHSSGNLTVSCGVPQGSILSPLLFLIYINDMVNVSNQLFLVLFADDSNAFVSGRDIDQIIDTINGTMDDLVVWLQSNKLTLNIKKTHFMIFSQPRKALQYTKQVLIDKQAIDRVENTRFLGVLVDDKLNFKDHIAHIRKKIVKGIYVLGRAKKFFDEITIKDLYYAFIHPYFNYCIDVWGSTCSTYFTPLVKLQKRAMRIMAGAPAKAHTLELFRRFNIVQLDEYRLYKYSIYIFLYKLVNQLHPLSVQSAFALNNSVHHYSTRHSEFLHVNTYECATRKRALRHQSSIIQNSNPGIDYRVSFPSLKFHIRTLLSMILTDRQYSLLVLS